MTDIFHEIEEDLRRERLRKLWNRFGGLIIALVVLVIVGTASWSGYKYWRQQQAIAASTRFQAAEALAAEGKHAEAAAAFGALAKDGPSGYRALALFRAAGEAAQVNKADGLVAFDALAQDTALDPLTRDVARLRAAILALDIGTPAQVEERVAALADGTGPLRHSARELKALAQYRAGDGAGAAKTAEQIISDAETPSGIRSRAELIRTLASSKGVVDAPAAVPAAPAMNWPLPTTPFAPADAATTAPATTAPAADASASNAATPADTKAAEEAKPAAEAATPAPAPVAEEPAKADAPSQPAPAEAPASPAPPAGSSQ